MNANKDEAYRCISIARECFHSGNMQKARKFVLKAMKLYPSVQIDGLESLIRSKSRSPSRRESTDPSTPEATTSANVDASPTPSQPTFTKSQVESVRQILACKDYYELFGLTRQCTDDELKKAYRTLALKFHPDKNSAPGATEAFKKIGTAFGVLTDPEKRRRYDQFGMADEQEEQTVHVRRHTDAYFQNDGMLPFDNNLFSVELFTMLFNFGFPFPQGHRHRHRPTRSRDSEHESNYFVYVQLIPLIILFALSFFSSVFVKEPFYNLARSNKYYVERYTKKHNVPYYVKKTFEQEFDGSIMSLENQVEEEYVGNLRFRCFRQKEYKENLIFRARYYGDDEEYQRASQMRMPDCERLVEMFGG